MEFDMNNLNYIKVSIVDNMKHIVRLGRIRNQKEKLLTLLRRKPRGVTFRAGRKIGIQNTRARIFELRQAGYQITTVRKEIGNQVKYFYVLG